ncbi:O-antigen translocase [Neotamlana sedimentorum]|uniref:O-antigen translocase n=1 Tax=Neotamlana sedimentorum TaxID=1435349 RepID=UPI000AB38549|nr:O-antigen translocase [Tamlana sedimentorum]
MKKIRALLGENLLLKITSLNALVIVMRLIISLFVQRVLAINVGEAGISKIGQLRNLTQILTGLTSLGTFNGVVKYVAEFKNDVKTLKDVFNTVFVFWIVGTTISSIVIVLNAGWIAIKLFGNHDFISVIYILGVIPFVIGANRIFHGVVNGLSEYKKYAKIDFYGYLLSVVVLIGGLYYFNLKGVLIAIVITPIIQLLIVFVVFGSILKKYITFKSLSLKVPYLNPFMGFMVMSLVSSVLLNYIEIDIRTVITNKINIEEAGYWTAVNFISKNYMAFSSGIFSLYVIPKFATIYSKTGFKNEVLTIYKTLLPVFGLGMLLVYVFRYLVIDIIYPNFTGMAPLFKWQLFGDFIRLASLVIAHQFLAKRMVKSFVFSELVSLGSFYFLSKFLVIKYGVEGVVMAHFIRYIIYLSLVVVLVGFYFRKKPHGGEI